MTLFFSYSFDIENKFKFDEKMRLRKKIIGNKLNNIGTDINKVKEKLKNKRSTIKTGDLTGYLTDLPG